MKSLCLQLFDYVTQFNIFKYKELLYNFAASCPFLDMLDTSRVNLNDPHPIWTAAGSNPVSIRKATIVTWLLLNVYRTGERLFQMKKAKPSKCIFCSAPLGRHNFINQYHRIVVLI